MVAKSIEEPPNPTPPSPVWLVLPSLLDDHFLHVLSDVGVSIDPGFGSPSAILALDCVNEVAQATIAKAKEAATACATIPVGKREVVYDPGRGQDRSIMAKRGPSKHAKSCAAPCRSSLQIKNLSII